MTPPALGAYRLATRLARPLAAAWLARRVRSGKEDPARLAERWGRASIARPPGALLWLHGASVGESLALLSLVHRAREMRPDVAILATSGTRAAAEIMARRLPAGAIHQFAPLDTPSATLAFGRHWRPSLGVFVESEIWPNLLLDARAGGARLALLSARLSDASVRRWSRAPASAKVVFGAFDLILARGADQAAKLASLGICADGRIDLKFGAAPLPRDDDLIGRFREGKRGPIILAASTHPGEDELMLEAFRVSGVQAIGARLIIAPRHTGRGETIARLAERMGFTVARRREEQAMQAAEVLVADTVGELGTWYALADLALIGGSWVPGIGGHNPLEPARIGCPIVAGPYLEAWPVYAEMAALGAARIVTAADLAPVIALTRGDTFALARMTAAAAAFVQTRDGDVVVGLDRTLSLLP